MARMLATLFRDSGSKSSQRTTFDATPPPRSPFANAFLKNFRFGGEVSFMAARLALGLLARPRPSFAVLLSVVSFALPAVAQLSPVSTLQDTFGGTSIGPLWTITSQVQGSITESGGTLNLAPNANTDSILSMVSASQYTLANSGAFVQVPQVVASGGFATNGFTLLNDTYNSLDWLFKNGNLYAVYTVNNGATIAATLTYDPVQHAWWRIREASGTVYWDTSPDGSTWTSRASLADTALFSLATMKVGFSAATIRGGLPAPGTAKYANLNYPPRFVVSGVPATVTAGTSQTVTVEVRNSYGNRLTGYRGTAGFTSSDAQAAVPANHTFTAADAGIYSAMVTFKTAGTQSITAIDLATPAITGVQSGITVNPASAVSLAVTGVPASVGAGLSNSATVTAYDSYGNIATGYLGTIRFTSSDAQAILPADRAFLAADLGRVTVSGIVFKTAGAQTLTATDTFTPSLNATQSGIVVSPAAAVSIAAAGFLSPTTAGAAGALTVTARDSYGNVATGYRGTVSFSSTDPQAVLPAATAFTSTDAGARSFSITLKTVGTQSITATDATLSSTQSNISVVASTASLLVVSGIANPIQAGTPASVTVEAKDSYGNRVPGYLGTVSFSSTDTQATLPAPYAFTSSDAGIHSFGQAIRFATVGTQSVTATQSTITGSQTGIAVTAGTPTWPSAVLTATATSTSTAHLSWTAAVDSVGVASYRVYKDGVLNQTVSGSTLVADVIGLTVGVTVRFQVQAGNAAGNWSTNGPTASVTPLPPDPATIAPAVDPTVATTMSAATSFLYTGPNAIQTGVAAGTIEAKRVAVARGPVHDVLGNPLGGVTVTVLAHPELGQTITRSDGRYDLAVNGGSPLTLRFTIAGRLEAQRQINAVWQEYVQVPDVVLVQEDPATTLIDLTNTTNLQVARGSVTTDDLGSRQATVFFNPGTTATLLMHDGTTRPVSTLHLHATEYTKGSTGPRAMPAPLPPNSAYTYALEFTADEATSVGAKTIQFSQPVYGYVENFVAAPVGAVVPDGFYDHDLGVWIPNSNGLVIKILSVTGGLADVDTDGTGVAADATKLAALNLSNGERARLAALYIPGQTLWRMPLLHFSCDDFNFPRGPLPDSGAPGPLDFKVELNKPPQKKNKNCGSIIECQPQVLGEQIPVVGTPYSLTYRSSRQRGSRANYVLNIMLPRQKQVTVPSGIACYAAPNRNPPCQSESGTLVPVRSRTYVDVAGRPVILVNPDPTGLSARFEWDGIDIYGRRLQGEQPVRVLSCWVYEMAVYSSASAARAAWATSGGGAVVASRAGGGFEFENCTVWNGKLGGWDDASRGLGGWALSSHHAYDQVAKTLYRGDGERSSASDLNRLVSNTVIGNGTNGTPVEGAKATANGVGDIWGAAAGPDGSVYFNSNQEIWKMKPDGTVTRLIAQGYVRGQPSLAVGSDGLLYIGDSGNFSYPITISRRESNGVLTVLATVPGSFSGPIGMAVAPDGAIYFSDSATHRVLRRATDGTLSTFAGLDNQTGGAFAGDGGPAAQGRLSLPQGLALAPDGTLFIADSGNNRVRAVTTDGIIKTVAGNGNAYVAGPADQYRNDGGLGINAGVNGPVSLAVARDGTLFIGENFNDIRRLTPDFIITTIAASDFTASQCPVQTKDCLPTHLNVGVTNALAVAPDGALLGGPIFGASIVRISSGYTAAASTTEMLIASEDGSEVYIFDLTGRHLRTQDALTMAVTGRFAYDSSWRLISITDRDGNVTTVQRDAQGNPTGVVGPYGQRTALSLDGNGYLASITNPANESVQPQYKPLVAGDFHAGGLLSQLTDGRLGAHLFEYDSNGYLTKDTNPAGAFQTLDRHGNIAPTSVTRATALGRATNYQVTWSTSGEVETSKVIDPAGLTTTTTTVVNPTNPTASAVSTTYPGGSTMKTTVGPDPRFGMDAPVSTATSTTPGGISRTMGQSRSAVMASASDPLTLSSATETFTLNGRNYTSTYDSVAKTVTRLTPAGRQTVITLDASGRPSQVQPPGVLPLTIQYDLRGRAQTQTQGTRTYSYGYDTLGRMQTLTDPLHSLTFAYDGANRPISTTLPDTNTIGASFDANSNLTSLTPPGRGAHAFAYQAGDLEQDYTPPLLGVATHVHTDYDLDRNLLRVLPDGLPAITPTYDITNGRLMSVNFNAGVLSYDYVPASGRVNSVTAPDLNKLTYGYDGPLLTSSTWSGSPVAGAVTRTYDADYRVATETAGGQNVTFQYDNDSLLTVAGALTINRSASPGSPNTGFVLGTTLGSVADSWTYNNYGEQQTYSASYGATALYSVDYGTRDNLGRIVTKTETIQGVTSTYSYGYDARNRLMDAGTAHYTYDANGNRLTGPGLTAAPVYDAQDRVTSYVGCTYVYKPDGSLQTKTCGASTTSYDYDAFGNLRHVTLPNATSIDYIIDGQNRRIGKKVNSVLAEGFLYRSQLQPAAWLNGDGSVRATFVYGLHPNVPEYMIQGGIMYRLVTDQVGGVRLVVNTSSGAVAERIDYDEFGNVLSDTAPGTQPFGFAGGLRDRDTGLTRFGARDYDPVTGRWTAKDPILFAGGTTDLYEYSGNDPINQSDLSGLTVSCTYNNATGQLACTDDTTGASASGAAESGGKPYGDPIPDGVYEILAREGRAGFFRLDPIDSNPRDDIHQPTGRDNFRLHRPGMTVGCIAAKDSDDWSKIDSLIRNTGGTFGVRDRTPVSPFRFWVPSVRYVTYYGTLTVRSR
jgi:RHS repeat-associated protein